MGLRWLEIIRAEMKSFEKQQGTGFTPKNVPWGKQPIHECHFIIREQLWTHIINNQSPNIEVRDFLNELKKHNVPFNLVPTYMARAFDLIFHEVKHQAYSDSENSKLLKLTVPERDFLKIKPTLCTFQDPSSIP